MEKIILIRSIYTEAFRNWKYLLVKNYFKVVSVICFALIAITIYAFIFRLSTGYAFGNL